MGEVKQINIKNRTFPSTFINIKNFDARLLKNDKKLYKGIAFTTLGISQRKKLMIVKIFIALNRCIYLLIMQVDMLKKKI